jgi:hypothetical protein
MKTKLLILCAVLCLGAAPAMADFIVPTEGVGTTFGFGTSSDTGDPPITVQQILDYITVNPAQAGKTLFQILPLT